MVVQMTSQVHDKVGIPTGSGGMVLRGVMFCLALCVLSGTVAAAQGDTGGPQSASPAASAAYGTTSWSNGAAQLQRSRVDTVPGQLLALAMTGRSDPSGRIFLGTESQGLYTSQDGGRTWQAAGGRLSPVGAGSLAVSALTVNPDDEQVVYAAATFSMATPQGLHSSQLVFISVDDGRHWFEMAPAPRLGQRITLLTPMVGQLLAVSFLSPIGTQVLRLQAGPELTAGLSDADPGMRAATARALGFSHDRSLLPVLLMHQQDPDALAGAQVAQAIIRLGDAAPVPMLWPALSTADEALQAEAATAMTLRHAEETIPRLSTMLQNDAPGASRLAAEALAAIGTPAAMAALTAPLADPQITPARQIAMGVLEATGQHAVPAVLAALNDSNAVVRTNAAEMLGWLSPVADPVQQAAPVAVLNRLLTDPAPAVQAQAAWALGEMGTVPASLVLIPAPIPAPVLAPLPAPIGAPMATLPVVQPPLAPIPDTLSDVWADFWIRAAIGTLLLLALLAIVLIGKGPRPASHLGRT